LALKNICYKVFPNEKWEKRERKEREKEKFALRHPIK
jgi:hypothetical protein